MVADCTIKINDRFYKAGEIIPDNVIEAVSAPVAEPPITDNAEAEVAEQPKQKRQYSRRK